MTILTALANNLPVTATFCVTAITAALGGFKMFTDRAGKVTEFRKAWIETIRTATAEFSGSVHTIAGRIAIRKKHGAADATDGLPFGEKFETELLPHWETLRLSYNKIILHLNPKEHIAYRDAEKMLSLIKDALTNVVYETGKFSSAAYDPSAQITEIEHLSKKCDMVVKAFLRDTIQEADNRIEVLIGRKRAPWWKFGKARKQRGRLVAEANLKLPSATKIAVDSLVVIASNNHAVRNVCTVLSNNIQSLSELSERTKPQDHDEVGSLLLLSAFATRELLHGRYNEVYENLEIIEQGIRAIDAAAAKTIKDVWTRIKTGETSYRWITWSSLIAPLLIFSGTIWLTYIGTTKLPKTVTTTFACTAQIPSISVPGANGNTGTMASLNCHSDNTP